MSHADTNIFQLCDRVRETGFAIHKYLGAGHRERVYENAILHRLTKQGIRAERRVPLPVYDEDGTLLGSYFADLLIDQCLILEVKARRALDDEHVAQLLGYLRASRLQHGLLINFGAAKFQIKKYIF